PHHRSPADPHAPQPVGQPQGPLIHLFIGQTHLAADDLRIRPVHQGVAQKLMHDELFHRPFLLPTLEAPASPSRDIPPLLESAGHKAQPIERTAPRRDPPDRRARPPGRHRTGEPPNASHTTGPPPGKPPRPAQTPLRSPPSPPSPRGCRSAPGGE